VSGVDLNRLPDGRTQAALTRVLHDNLVLCIRGQNLAPMPFRNAMAQFGVPVLRKQLAQTPECAEVNIISSEDRDVLGDGKKIVNGANWHTDDSFMREPSSLTMLYGVVVSSSGGDTSRPQIQFEPEAGRISTRTAAEMAAMPEVTHPFVRTHPETGRRSPRLAAGRHRDLGQPLHHAQGQCRLSRG